MCSSFCLDVCRLHSLPELLKSTPFPLVELFICIHEYSLCTITVYGFDKCIMSCIRHYRIIQNSSPPQKYISCASHIQPSSAQFSSASQLCPTLCDPMNHSTPGLPVHHQLLESIQTHAHRVSDAIQPSHPLSSPSPPAPNPSQHQGLF